MRGRAEIPNVFPQWCARFCPCNEANEENAPKNARTHATHKRRKERAKRTAPSKQAIEGKGKGNEQGGVCVCKLLQQRWALNSGKLSEMLG